MLPVAGSRSAVCGGCPGEEAVPPGRSAASNHGRRAQEEQEEDHEHHGTVLRDWERKWGEKTAYMCVFINCIRLCTNVIVYYMARISA